MFRFCFFFFFLCIKCPPYRQRTRYTRHSVAGVQKGLPWRLFKQRQQQQQQPHCTLLPACLHFLFGFHGSSRWAAPLPWQASLGVFSLEVIVAAAAALLYPARLPAPSPPAWQSQVQSQQVRGRHLLLVARRQHAMPTGCMGTGSAARLAAFLVPCAGLRFNDTRDKQQQGLPQQQQQQQRLQQQQPA